MKHILLVEDDLSMLNGLSIAIKKQGYALDIARTRDGQKQFMFLTAMDEETDMIMGLDIGGDDYITKPFKLAFLFVKLRLSIYHSDGIVRTDLRTGSTSDALFFITLKFSLKTLCLRVVTPLAL